MLHRMKDLMARGVLDLPAKLFNLNTAATPYCGLVFSDGTPTGEGFYPGCIAVDVTNKKLLQNNGTATTASWVDFDANIDINELTAAVVDVAADSFAILDATDSGSKKESLADYATAIAGNGLKATSGVLEVDMNELTGAAVNVAADSIAIIDADDNGSKKEAVADLVTAMAGTDLSASAGVLSVPNTASFQRWKYVAASKYTATPSDTDTLTMSDTSDMATGLPIKYTIGGTTYYGVVVAVSANTSIDIWGASLGGDVTALYVGTAEMVLTASFFVDATYGDGAETDLLTNDQDTMFKWTNGKSYLVGFSGTHATADTGAAQPKVNVQINNAAVSTNDSNNGIQLGAADTWVNNSAVAINTSNYDINWGEELEIACTVAGTNTDAEDLTIQCVFVMA